ncbi:transglutaminaseTgpA domain-containing protein [Pseudofrankia sp. DC12]|uniref:transglutaminaseTgpA domain-containing protein n=1 Tax=Pseudofrankia sp. DC12 TaxID=683315 RepID=UPI000696FB4C|nr:transglutaminaseTgpA domain-containing protein [Pseudofrankia sp. DC12]
MSGPDRPDLVENARRREWRGVSPRGTPSGRPVDGPTSPTVPIVQRSEADTVRVPVPPLPAARHPAGRGRSAREPAAEGGWGPEARGPEAPGPQAPGPEAHGPGSDAPAGRAGTGSGLLPRSRPAQPPAPAEPAGRRAAALLLVAALAAVDGWGLVRLFSAADLRLLVPVAAVAPVLLVMAASLGRRRAAPFALSALLWTAGFVLVAAALVTAGAGGPVARLAEVRTGVLAGPTRLLDVAVPAPADADLLVVPFLVTWLAAALGAELVVRTRTRLLPAGPALLGLLAATAAAVPGPGSNLAPAAALAALAGLLALARRPVAPMGTAGPGTVGRPGTGPRSVQTADGFALGPAAGGTTPGERSDGSAPAGPIRITLGPGRPSRPLAAARATGALAVVVVAAVAAGALLPAAFAAGGPVDPRAYRATPADQVDGLNPLSELAGWTARPDDNLFTIRLAGQSAGPVPLRLAVLSDFDGANWTSSAPYTRVGQTVTAARDQPSTGGAPVTQELTVAGLTGTLLPALDRPVQVGPSADAGLAADLADGLLLRTAPVTTGERFTVVSRPAPVRSVAQLAALTSGTAATADQDAEYLAVPANVPPVLRALARVAAGQGTGPFQQAALLQHYLATNFQFDPRVPPGHSLAHVEHFVADTRRGTSEQFATTFVLAARLLGLPSRVVVGFTPAAPAGSAAVTVTGRQALAWAEVRFDGAGWLPFFPTPSAVDAQGAALAGSTQGESAAQAALVDAAVRGPLAVPAAVNRPAAAAAAPSGRAGHLRGLVEWVAVGVGALAAGYLGIALGRPLARRRRRLSARHSPRERVVLAWEHAVDALLAVGVPVPASASPAEVVELGAQAVGGERADGRRAGAAGAGASMSALRGLAHLATLALFGPDDGAGRPEGTAGAVLVAGATVVPVPGSGPMPTHRHGPTHAAGRVPRGLAGFPVTTGQTGPAAGRPGPGALADGRRTGRLGLTSGRTGPLALPRDGSGGPTGSLASPAGPGGADSTMTGAPGWDGAAGRRSAGEARRLARTVEQAAWRSTPWRHRLTARLSPRAVLTGRPPLPRG